VINGTAQSDADLNDMKTASTPPPNQTPHLLSGRRGSNPITEIKAWCLERADEWYEQNEPGLARQFLQHALGVDPHDVSVWIALGSLHFTAGNLDSALLAFTQSNELDPGNSTIQLHLALTHQQREDLAEADWFFKQAVELKPDDVGALKLYSGFLMAHECLNEARLHLEHALSIDLDDVELFLRLGVCCFRTNDFRAAHACFNRVLQIDPANLVARENMAIAATRLSQAAA
jgi:cytochrome c-type biogenesis protein CcmH/NrfG